MRVISGIVDSINLSGTNATTVHCNKCIRILFECFSIQTLVNILFFASAFTNCFCFFSAQGLDEAMLRVMGTGNGATNVIFATNNDLVNRIYGVIILLPSRLFSCTIILFFCSFHFRFRKYEQKF
jgi:hypothetical protein